MESSEAVPSVSGEGSCEIKKTSLFPGKVTQMISVKVPY